MLILYSILRSLFFLIINRPKIIFGMGGYASFPICIAASILRIKFLIYENNLIIGKANKYLLPFAEKILISNKEIEGIHHKYKDKVIEIGNIIKKEIINLSKALNKMINKKLAFLFLEVAKQQKHLQIYYLLFLRTAAIKVLYLKFISNVYLSKMKI